MSFASRPDSGAASRGRGADLGLFSLTLNDDATLQTHLFEDRVMKMSHVHIGDRCTIGSQALVLYDTQMEAGAELNDLSLLMKGETLPAGTRWEGIPAQPSRHPPLRRQTPPPAPPGAAP